MLLEIVVLVEAMILITSALAAGLLLRRRPRRPCEVIVLSYACKRCGSLVRGSDVCEKCEKENIWLGS